MNKLFYVENIEGGFEKPIIDILESNNYKIVFKENSADFIIKGNASNAGVGRAKASVMLIDNKSGELLGRTKEYKGQTTIFNGYANPKMLAIKKVTKNHLLDLIKKHI